MTDLALRILMSAQDTNASSIVNNLASSLANIGKTAGPIGIAGAAIAAVGVAAVGVAATSIKMAGDFQAGMTSLVTGAGEAQSNIAMVSQGILQMSVDTATSTQQLTSGMYMIESAGYHGAAGLSVLKAAAEGAKVGNADLGVTANALTTILTDYHMKGTQAAQAMNALTATVASGKTHLQDLASAMGTVLPLASSLGLSFPQVAGAIATMTNAGMSAQRASMNLSNAIRSLSAPSGVAQKSMQAVGLSAQQLKNTLSTQGLSGAIQLVEDHVGKKFPAGSVQAVTAFKNIMGGATGYNVALMLGGKNMQTFTGDVNNIAAAMKGGSGAITGWTAVQEDFNFKMEQAKQAINVVMIQLGTALLPIFSRLVGAITPFIMSLSRIGSASSPLASAFANIQKAVQPILSTITSQLIPAIHNLVAAIAPIVAAIIHWIATSGILPAAFAVISVAVRIVIVVLSVLINIIAAVIRWFSTTAVGIAAFRAILIILGTAIAIIGAIILAVVIPAFAMWVAGAVSVGIANVIAFAPIILIILAVVAVVTLIVLAVTHWGEIAHWLQGVWAAFSSWFMGALGAIGAFFVGIWNGIASFFVSLWGRITGGAKAGGAALSSWWTGLWNGIVAAARAAWNFIVNAVRIGAMLLLAVILGPFLVIGALFVWLYNHNYYFKALVDAIVRFVRAGIAWLQNAWSVSVAFIVAQWQRLVSWASSTWNNITTAIKTAVQAAWSWLISVWTTVTTWISTQWQRLVAWATTLWNNVTTAIKTAVTIAWNWLVSIWTTASTWLQTQWNKFATFAQTAWQAVSTVFAGIWTNYIASPMQNLWNRFVSWFNNLASQAVTWGRNVIQGIINGINSMLGAVGNAAANVAHRIASFLGFHSPTKLGPGATADKWAPNFIRMYSIGLQSGVPQMQHAVSAVAAPLTALNPGTVRNAPSAGGSANGVYAPTVNVHVHGARSQNEAQQIANEVDKLLAKKYRGQYSSASLGVF